MHDPAGVRLRGAARRRLQADWIGAIRRFAFAAWLFLGIGILLGARWSYSELGWGGYWGWDAVENASLMPWLTGTAFLHSLMIQEKRGMLKIWNVSLVLATGTLAVMGTFLVRSGILNSIHAFGGHTLGVPFVILIGLLIGASIYLVVSRRELLRSEMHLDSLLSREAAFLANNIVLVALCFVIFWGTYFPLISEALSGHEASVGPPWFDRYTVPLALILVLLSGIGPVIAWRRATFANARRNFLVPIAAGLATFVGPGAHRGGPQGLRHGDVLLRRFRARQRRAKSSCAAPACGGRSRASRRHAPCWRSCDATAGATAATSSTSAWPCCSSAWPPPRPSSTRSSGGCRPASRPRWAPTRSATSSPTATVTPANDAAHTGALLSLGARLDVTKGHGHVATLEPSEGFYPSGESGQGTVGSLIGGQPVSHIAMDGGFTRDVWSAIEPDIEAPALQKIIAAGNRTLPPEDALIALGVLARSYLQHPPQAQFHFIVSPLVLWIWLGGGIVLLGGLIALWPAPSTVRRRVAALERPRALRDLVRA